MTASQQRALEGLWPDFGIEFAAAPLDLVAVFGRDAPRVLEIGFGNGDSLVELARAMPDIDFVGVDVHEPGVGHCLIKIREAKINNLRLIVHDAVEVLERQILADSLQRINLYFPDPWPKKRHHKRRIVTPYFLELCARALHSGGTLNIATDWENYAQHIELILNGNKHFSCAERREHKGDKPLMRPQTKFECRGLRHGHRIWDWCYDCVK